MYSLVGKWALHSLLIALLLAPAALVQGQTQRPLKLPGECFDTSNTAKPCQILFAYAELLEFANIPDYIGFIESSLAEMRGELPFLPIDETADFERFVAAMEADEPLSDAMYLEISQFMSHYFQRYAEFHHVQDPVSMQIQELWFNQLLTLNAQLHPELDAVQALETTFLRADPRLADAIAALQPLTQGQTVLSADEEGPLILTWLGKQTGFSDKYVAERLLMELATLQRAGGVAFDLPRFDQRPAIGAMLNAPVDAPIYDSAGMREDIYQMREVRSGSDNLLQSLHFYRPYQVNHLLALLVFAEAADVQLPRIPYAQSRGLIDYHFYVETPVLGQLRRLSLEYGQVDPDIAAGILALRLGASLPVVGSHLVRLEDNASGDYTVVELTPVMARIIYAHTSGYVENEVPD